jgi:hypothetical protein
MASRNVGERSVVVDEYGISRLVVHDEQLSRS